MIIIITVRRLGTTARSFNLDDCHIITQNINNGTVARRASITKAARVIFVFRSRLVKVHHERKPTTRPIIFS